MLLFHQLRESREWNNSSLLTKEPNPCKVCGFVLDTVTPIPACHMSGFLAWCLLQVHTVLIPDPCCIHIIKDRTLPFPWKPRSTGRIQQYWTESLSRRCLVFTHSLFSGLVSPLTVQRSCLCVMPMYKGSRALRRCLSSPLCRTLYFKLTSRFGIVLGVPP